MFFSMKFTLFPIWFFFYRQNNIKLNISLWHHLQIASCAMDLTLINSCFQHRFHYAFHLAPAAPTCLHLGRSPVSVRTAGSWRKCSNDFLMQICKPSCSYRLQTRCAFTSTGNRIQFSNERGVSSSSDAQSEWLITTHGVFGNEQTLVPR